MWDAAWGNINVSHRSRVSLYNILVGSISLTYLEQQQQKYAKKFMQSIFAKVSCRIYAMRSNGFTTISRKNACNVLVKYSLRICHRYRITVHVS